MIHKHTTRNGLRIVLEEIPTVRSVTIGIWILTGSRNEIEATNGISHFLEHMFFKGTSKRSAQDIAEAFDSIGGHINAFTSKEYTCIYAKVLDTHKELALEILTDMFFNSSFDEEELIREKKVVYEEIKMYEDTPDDLVHDLLSKAAYRNHPLGFPILGTEKQLETFDRAALQNYMKERYTAENVVISIAGNTDQTFIDTVEDHFSDLSGNLTGQELNVPAFYSDSISRSKNTEQAHFCLGYPSLAIGDENTYSLIVLNNAFGGSMSSRLFQEVREKQGLAYSVFSYNTSYLDSGLLTIYAGTGKDQLPLLKETIYQTIDQLVEKGLTDKELHNSKEQLKGNLMLSLESTNSRMSRNARNELLLRKHRTLDEVIHQIEAVNHDSVRQITEAVFKHEPASALISPLSE